VSAAVAVILGIVQGLTEFLPVSSSAHLILARAFLGWELPADFALAFDVALHVGTLAAILLYFRAEITAMLRSVPYLVSPGSNQSARLAQRIVAGTIPVVIVGLLFNDAIEEHLRTPVVAAWSLAIGGVFMFAAERLGARTRAEDSVSWTDALLIGCAQASALIPGVSRSGSTIALGMFLGFRRDAAARFTFLLAIPAMFAAAGKEGLELVKMGLPSSALQLMVLGLAVSAAVGYVTIKYFLRFLGGNRLDLFAYYRWVLAAMTFVWLAWRH
jgi:undecaprenyl-diphosphatase